LPDGFMENVICRVAVTLGSVPIFPLRLAAKEPDMVKLSDITFDPSDEIRSE
jgi:hypothetical protein